MDSGIQLLREMGAHGNDSGVRVLRKGPLGLQLFLEMIWKLKENSGTLPQSEAIGWLDLSSPSLTDLDW